MRERIKKYTPRSILLLYGKTKQLIERQSMPRNERTKLSLRTLYNGQFKVTYRGVPMLRFPTDYVIYQMILSEVQPDLVIEIGTNSGGSTLYIANLMDSLGHGMIHSIDIDDHTPEVVRKHPRIKLFKDGWQKYDLKEAGGFSKILVIDDASHMYEDVRDALEKFAPVVSADSYFIVEDGIIDELGLSKQYHGGPLRAIREFLPKNKNFIIDRNYCDIFGKNGTANTNGYLKKVQSNL